MNKPLRWWIVSVCVPVLGVLSTCLLCFISSGAQWTAGWLGFDGPVVAICLSALFAGASIVVTAVASARAQARIVGEHILSVKKSLWPTMARVLEAVRAGVDDDGYRRVVTEVMHDLRAYVGTENTVSDANFYVLSGDTRLSTVLTRINATDTGARRAFRRTRGKDATAVEETVLVDRICDRHSSWAKDVTRKKWQKEYHLDPSRVRNYRSFMSVPVVLDGVVMGMLSVNSSSKDVIEAHHLDYMYLVAQIVARFHESRSTVGPVVHTGAQGEEHGDD